MKMIRLIGSQCNYNRGYILNYEKQRLCFTNEITIIIYIMARKIFTTSKLKTITLTYAR